MKMFTIIALLFVSITMSAQNIYYQSENLIVIRALPGTAQSIASTVDNARWQEVLGTVAGDDTLLVIVKPKEAVQNVIDRFKNLIGGSNE